MPKSRHFDRCRCMSQSQRSYSPRKRSLSHTVRSNKADQHRHHCCRSFHCWSWIRIGLTQLINLFTWRIQTLAVAIVVASSRMLPAIWMIWWFNQVVMAAAKHNATPWDDSSIVHGPSNEIINITSRYSFRLKSPTVLKCYNCSRSIQYI